VTKTVLPKVLLPLLGLLVAADLLLVLLNLAILAATGTVLSTVFPGEEQSIPTWWSAAQLFLAGLCLLAVSYRRWFAGFAARGLGLLGLLLVALSVDEVATLHERMGVRLDGATRFETTFHATGIWFLVLGIPFVLLTVVLLRFVWAELAAVPGTRRRLLAGLGIFVFGALGMEALNNFAIAADQHSVSNQSAGYLLTVIVEEGVELVAASVLLWAGAVFLVNHPSVPGMLPLLLPEVVQASRAAEPAVAGRVAAGQGGRERPGRGTLAAAHNQLPSRVATTSR
jgi:hypothetical protein